ncbi:MAG: RluA family pseudouridine synthase [Eubacterium sp.]|nr:RluA family pseudouridine synthase [Eubacterium sp.]
MKEIKISENDSGQRLDRFLGKAFPKLSQGVVRKSIRKNQIKINGKKQSAEYILAPGDILKIYLDDSAFFRNPVRENAGRLPKPVIVYEDENIMILDKPAGLLSHEGNEICGDTLIGRVIDYLKDCGQYNSDLELSFCPALCNRIDRNTSGLIIAAKNAESLRIMSQKIKDREITKIYRCIAIGDVQPKSAELISYLEKYEDEIRVRITDTKTLKGKLIKTGYRVVESFFINGYALSLLEVKLVTGRTHQIRAHLAHMGYPLLGDGKYGVNKINKIFGLKAQALCSYKIIFNFKTDAGNLNYLLGRSFVASEPVFIKKIFEENTN